tara:strand:- start:611 stop:964 length:354 start_codon:yes stop_codon:yes gene_type:complete
MAETLLPQGIPFNPENGLRVRLGHKSATLGDNTTKLTPQDAQFQILTPTGHRDVTLAAEEASQGLFFVIKNGAAATHKLVVKNDNGDTIDEITHSCFGIFACDGDSWVSAVGSVTYA